LKQNMTFADFSDLGKTGYLCFIFGKTTHSTFSTYVENLSQIPHPWTPQHLRREVFFSERGGVG